MILWNRIRARTGASPWIRVARPRRCFAPDVDLLEDKVVLQTLPHQATTTLLTILPSAGTSYRRPIKLTASVSGFGFLGSGGGVTFYDGPISLGFVALSSDDHTASLTLAGLAIGSHTLTARFSGATIHSGPGFFDAIVVDPSTSGPVEATISPATTTTDVGQSNAAPGFGQATTLYAVVAPGDSGVDPTGSVTFFDGATPVGTAALTTSNGQTSASLTVSTLAVGSHSITVSFGGDGTNGASTSAATRVTVAPNTTTAAGQSNATPTLGQATTLYAVVAPTTTGGPTPTGLVYFLDGPTILGTATLATPNGQTNTSLTVSSLSAGSHPIIVFYAGDQANSWSSATTTITVAGPA